MSPLTQKAPMPVDLLAPASAGLYPIAGLRIGVAEAAIRTADRKDLTLFLLAEGTSVDGVFTPNRFCAAPVHISLAFFQAEDGIRDNLFGGDVKIECEGFHGDMEGDERAAEPRHSEAADDYQESIPEHFDRYGPQRAIDSHRVRIFFKNTRQAINDFQPQDFEVSEKTRIRVIRLPIHAADHGANHQRGKYRHRRQSGPGPQEPPDGKSENVRVPAPAFGSQIAADRKEYIDAQFPGTSHESQFNLPSARKHRLVADENQEGGQPSQEVEVVALVIFHCVGHECLVYPICAICHGLMHEPHHAGASSRILFHEWFSPRRHARDTTRQ